MKEKITRIAVFDFDGTLVLTPTPEEGKKQYKTKTGNDWPHKGWWGKRESMDMDVFDIPTNKDVIAAYEIEKNTENTVVFLLTGRLKKYEKEVKKILDAHGLTFDGYFFNTGGDTLDVKIGKFNDFMVEYPNVKEFAVWDDRVPHIATFQEWGDKQKDLDFKITVVEGNCNWPQ